MRSARRPFPRPLYEVEEPERGASEAGAVAAPDGGEITPLQGGRETVQGLHRRTAVEVEVATLPLQEPTPICEPPTRTMGTRIKPSRVRRFRIDPSRKLQASPHRDQKPLALEDLDRDVEIAEADTIDPRVDPPGIEVHAEPQSLLHAFLEHPGAAARGGAAADQPAALFAGGHYIESARRRR